MTEMVDMRLTGNITSVVETLSGITLSADVAAAATVLPVMDPWTLPSSGSLRNDAISTPGVTEGTGGEDVQFTAVDLDAYTVTLANPLANAHKAGEWFYLVPAEVERTAYVRLADDDVQAIGARIPTSLNNALPAGQIDPPVPCAIQRIGDEWILADLPSSDPTMASAQTLVTGGITVIDPVTGETVASIGPDGASFENLSADSFYSPTAMGRNYENKTLYVDPVNGFDTNGGEALLPMSDLFERSLGTTWGTSDSGHLWTQAQYQGIGTPDVGTIAGAGRLRTNGVSQSNVMQSAFSALDAEGYGLFAFPSLPGAGTADAGIGRIIDSNTLFGAGFTLRQSTGRIELAIESRSGGAYAVLASVDLGAFVANAQWRLRMQVQANPDGGTDIRAKAWPVASAEPEAWMLTFNDPTTTSGINTTGPWGAYQRSASAATGTVGFHVYDLAFNVIDASGQVIDTSLEAVGPLATIAAALAEVGQWNDGEVRINLAAGTIGEFNEPISIHGLAGGGRLIIDGAGKAVINGIISLFGVHQYIELRDFTLQDTGDTAATASIDMRVTRHVECLNIRTNANGRPTNIVVAEGSEARIDGCQLDGAGANCLNVFDGGMAYCNGNQGVGGSTSSYRASNGIIFVNGTKPTGATATATGGQIFGTTSSNSGGTTQGGSSKKTKTFKCNATKTWRPSWWWKSGDEPIQGSYGGNPNSRGMFYYGTSLAIASKTIDNAKITLRRLATGGASSPQSVYLWTHNWKTQSDSGAESNTPTLQEGPIKVGELAWGQTKTFSLPNGWGQDFLNGTRRGVAIYVGDGSPYLWLAGRGGNDQQGAITLTYH